MSAKSSSKLNALRASEATREMKDLQRRLILVVLFICSNAIGAAGISLLTLFVAPYDRTRHTRSFQQFVPCGPIVG